MEKSKSILFVIRHSERADQAKGSNVQVEEITDPPLTPYGVELAQTTGTYLKDYL